MNGEYREVKVLIVALLLCEAMVATYAAENTEEYCDVRRTPVVVYRKGYTTNVDNREPIDYVAKTDVSRKKLYYFTEILGARNHVIEHQWFKNGAFVARVPYQIGAERWRIWSSKNLASEKGDQWEVRVSDGSGCLISRESVTVSEQEIVRNSRASGWKSPSQAVRDIISDGKKTSENALLLFKGTKHVEQRGDYGDTPLLMAVRLNRHDAVVELVQANANPYVWDAVGETPLQIAKRNGNNQTIDTLGWYLKTSPPVWAVTQAIVSSGVESGQPIDRYDSYAPAGAPLYLIAEHIGIRGRTIRHQWSYKNEVVADFEHYIEANIWSTQSVLTIPVNQTGPWAVGIVDESGTVIRKIKLNIEKEKTRIVKPAQLQERLPLATIVQLIRAWAPIERITYLFRIHQGHRISSYQKRYILFGAVESGNIGMVKYLISLQWPIDNVHSKKGETPLTWATENEKYAMVRYLVGLGADVNEKALRTGLTPLSIAIMQGAADQVEYLLGNGADPTLKNKANITPADYAIHGCRVAILRLLKEHEVQFPTHDRLGKPNSYWLKQCAKKNAWPKDLMFLWEG